VVPAPSYESVIDVHAHHFAVGLPDLALRTGDSRWPSLVVDVDRTRGRIMLGDQAFRAVPAALWDRAARLDALDTAGVTVQLISPVPIMLTYWAEPRLGHDFARAVHDSIAEEIRAADGRLRGLGTVPLQDPELAISELRRLTSDLGLAGVEIGTHAAGRELDDPALSAFWAEVEACGAAVFVHPLDGGGDAIRRRGVPYDFGLGMLTDTAMAAVALLNGGVLDRHPALRICLAHGCGTFAWAFPRLQLGSQLGGDPSIVDRYADLARRLWADSLVFDPAHVGLLVQRFGVGHVMIGTDYPFVPGQLEGARAWVDKCSSVNRLTSEERTGLAAANAMRFLDASSALTSTPVPKPSRAS
jgi:aminocarboxymuconate-semialdehyde decarboxylase